MERAADWIFSHAAELDEMDTDETQETEPQCPDGDGSEFHSRIHNSNRPPQHICKLTHFRSCDLKWHTFIGHSTIE